MASGPEPGVGCAGRGILSTFALFDRLGLNTDDFDAVVYDVLGDVVCGGFAVSLRKGFADAVVVITSEEFMAIYAANNIFKGIHNFDSDGPRLAGILLNSRGIVEDPQGVERFSRVTAAPIIGRIPRSDRLRQAEKSHRTVVDAFPDTPEADLFRHQRKSRAFGCYCPRRGRRRTAIQKHAFPRAPAWVCLYRCH